MCEQALSVWSPQTGQRLFYFTSVLPFKVYNGISINHSSQQIIFSQCGSQLLWYQMSYQSRGEKKAFQTIFSQSLQPALPAVPTLDPPSSSLQPEENAADTGMFSTAVLIPAQDSLLWMLLSVLVSLRTFTSLCVSCQPKSSHRTSVRCFFRPSWPAVWKCS